MANNDNERGVSDRPNFNQNGIRRSSDEDYREIGQFRQALPQFLAVSVKNILLFVYGMTLGFPTIVIPAIQGGEGREPSDIVLNRDEISWFSSINLICVPLGCVFSGAFSQPIGKRRAMQLVNLPILASWLFFHFATRTEHLYAALCLSGLGGGLMEAPVLTYVAEITEPRYRGILSALGSTCVISGVFIQFIMGSFLDWRTIAAVSTAFPVVCITALFFIPESPTWLIRQHKFKEAIRALQWLRGWVPEHRIEAEFNMLYDQLITKPALEEAEDELKKMSKCSQRMRIFRKQGFWFPFLLVAYTFFVGHFSGKTVLQTYAVQIFHTLKAPINKYHATILLGVAELIATVLCVILIHFTGKRPLVLISTTGAGLCFFGTATYAYFLNVVPGFAINNVVVNASSIVSQENIITVDNITKIFEMQEQALLMAGNQFDDATTILPDFLTTISDDISMEESSYNRTKRDVDRFVPPLDFVEFNDTSAENATDELIVTTTSEPNLHQILPSQKPLSDPLPGPDNVANNILVAVPVPKQKKNYLAWIPLVLLLSSAFFAHLGIRLIPWILIGEVFPANVRSTASGLAGGIGYIFGFLANKLFLQMLAVLTMPGTFWLYSCVALSGAVVLYFALPETEGRTLGEIEEHFSKKSKSSLFKDTPHLKRTVPQIPLDNLQANLATGTKVVQLQQSDLVHRNSGKRPEAIGTTNRGYVGDLTVNNSTTHL